MIRARFFIKKEECKGDYRPITWPIKYPYWCTGENDDNFVLVTYVDSADDLIKLWPEAYDIEYNEVSEISFSSRFPKPFWFKE